MRIYDLIEKKKHGKVLSREEWSFVIREYLSGRIPDYQISALLMAIWFRGMEPEETADLTLEMADSGDRVDLSGIRGVIVDKHSTGGVGDKTTFIVIAIASYLGVKVAKMSGRGLGHTGGTVDKMESIPGLKTELDTRDFIEQVNRVGAAIVGQSGNLAPADKALYALRDVTATVDSIPLIASSIMSKKLAAGADAIVLDVKLGTGAFMKKREDAVKLAHTMVDIGTRAGKKVVALITDMNTPLGQTVGNSLEMAEVAKTLRGEGPEDLTTLSLELAAWMVHLAGICSVDEARKKAEQAIRDGSAYKKFIEIVEAQGGEISSLEDMESFTMAKYQLLLRAPRSGFVCAMNAEEVGNAAAMLGAGRKEAGDSIDPTAGIILYRKTGDKVVAEQPLAQLRASGEVNLEEAADRLLRAYMFSDHVEQKPLIYEIIEA